MPQCPATPAKVSVVIPTFEWRALVQEAIDSVLRQDGVNAYTTLEHEFRARLRGTTAAHGRLRRIHAVIDLAAIKALVERYERQAYEESDRVLVNYESVRRLLGSKWRRLGVSRVAYAPETAFLDEMGVGSGCPAPDGLPPDDAPLVVAVSRQDPRKGVDVLIRALGELRASGAPFRAALVGGGILLDRHRQLARAAGLDDTTVLPGFVPAPAAYLRAAEVFALPSLQEASGSVSLLEALQTGVAVVASGIDGIPEDVTDDRSALLVPATPRRSPSRVAPGPDRRAASPASGPRGPRGVPGALLRRGAHRGRSSDVYAELGVEAAGSAAR